VLFGSSTLRVWLPSRRCQLFLPSEAFFSSPRSWASLFKALFRNCDPFPVSRKRSAHTFSYQTH
jgi:hypothetical protein